MRAGSPKPCRTSGHSPLISRKSSAMTIGPLSMGLPEPLKIRPGGGQWALENAQGQPWASHCCPPPTPPPAPTCPHMPSTLSPSPSTLSYPQRAGYSDCPLGVFLSFLETFIGKALAQNNHSNGVSLGAGERRGPGRADLGRKLGAVQSISG